MARDSGGTYTPPAGQPVVTGTTISSATFNTLVDDLGDELTDSLSRSGKGGMTAALRLANGTSGAPSVAFTNDTGVGIYRSASGTGSIVAGGNEVASWDASGFYVGSGGASSAITLYKSSDQSTTSSSDSDVTDMSFSAAANGVYSVEAYIRVSRGSTATAAQFTFTGPASPTDVLVSSITDVANVANYFGSTSFGVNFAIMSGASTSPRIIPVFLSLVNGSNAGTVQLRFSSGDNTNTVTVQKGSWMRYTRLA